MTTAYESIIWLVESPLNEDEPEWEPPLYIEYEEIDAYPSISMQQRMFVILGVATVLIVVFGFFVWGVENPRPQKNKNKNSPNFSPKFFSLFFGGI